MIYDLAEMISLFLTPAALYVCIATVSLFFQNAIRLFYKDHRQAVHWFAMGIVVGFTGSFLDNSYWGAAWSSKFINSIHADWWFANGAIANIPFRQMALIIAGYCHIRAGISYVDDVADSQEVKQLHSHLIVSFVVGFAYVAILLWVRN